MNKLYQILEEAQSVVNCDRLALHMTDEVLNLSDFTPLYVPSTQVKPVVHKSSKASKKRAWKKPKDKPKRPLSAYNLFFQEERNSILAALPNDNEPIDDGMTEEERRRKHRKTHGKIGFADLARSIASKWKGCEENERATFEARAAKEKQRYKLELEAWKKAQEGLDTTSASEKRSPAVDATSASDKSEAAKLAPKILNAATRTQTTQSFAFSKPFVTPAVLQAMSTSAMSFIERSTSSSSSLHGSIMAHCAANLLKQSPGFHMPLSVFAQHMNGARMQTQSGNPFTMNAETSFSSEYGPSMLEEPLPDESFSKDTFFETDMDDDESTCTTSGLFSDSEADDGEYDRRQPLADAFKDFLYGFGNEGILS